MNNLFKYPSKYLVRNAIKTPDGTVLESTHRNDFRPHVDTVTGTNYAIDGGLSYRRIFGNKYEDLSVETDDHFIAREHLTWGTYGKDGDQPLTYKKIKDLDTGHIYNILKNCNGILEQIKLCLTYELLYRAFNDSGWKSDLPDDEEVEWDE